MKNVEKYSHKIAELLSIKCTGESNCDECPYDEFCSQMGVAVKSKIGCLKNIKNLLN